MADASPVGRRACQMLRQDGEQRVGAGEVGGHDREQAPGALAGIGVFRFVGGGLFDELAVGLVAKLRVFVAVLKGN